MSRRPVPAALLIDHPALPLPRPQVDGLAPDLEGALSIRSLPLNERRRCAVQLLAACALAAEFDLWPGRRALEASLAYRRPGGAQAVINGFPMPLTASVKRLGAFDPSFDRLREAAVDSISRACGLATAELRSRTNAGFFLENHLWHCLDALGVPFDAMTGRNLWAFCWQPPPLPDSGEVVFWKVPLAALARRIAGAVWLMLAKDGARPLLVCDGPTPPEAVASVPLVLCGRLAPESLTHAERWARSGRTESLVVGLFPAGWDPPGFPGRRTGVPLSTQLAVTGVSLDRARREVDAREGSFDPASLADRDALTDAARRRFVPPPRSPVRMAGISGDAVHRVLSLRRDGMAAEQVLRLSGETTAGLVARITDGAVVVDGDRCRLPAPHLLKRDPLHSDVAADFDERDPQRWLHESLGGGSPQRLEGWARARLDALENRAVREILGQAEPGELGPGLTALLAEACLASLDLAGARDACDALVDDTAFAFRMWIDVIDRPAGWRLPLAEWEARPAVTPRIAAEAALFVLRLRKGGAAVAGIDPERVLGQAITAMSGSLASWYVIEQAALLDDGRLFDAQWCSQIAGGQAALTRFLDHKRALRLVALEQYEEARSILVDLADRESEPGRLARIFFDLAGAVDDADEEAAHLLRAMRLYEVAGFRNVKRRVLFNLAMADIDQLRIDRAEQRLMDCRMEANTQWSIGEGMLAVARGDLGRFSSIVGGLPTEIPGTRGQRWCEVLRGIDALLHRRFDRARRHLEGTGEDGEPWLAILEALAGRVWPTAPTRDPWRLVDACAAIARNEAVLQSVEGASIGALDARQALALAVADRVLARRQWIADDSRTHLSAALRKHGLDGWAREVRRDVRTDPGPLMRAVTRLADTGNLEEISREGAEPVLRALGVTGLEFRSDSPDSSPFSIGTGDAAEVVRHGSLTLAALGSAPSSGDGWGLLSSVLGLIAPGKVAKKEQARAGNLGIIGESPAIELLREHILRSAPSQLAVLISGETGVGKELAARAIHGCSGRDGLFQPVNVAALPDSLFEAEMYGSVKGAFTGANYDRPGFSESADGGTLFLDEIGDLALPLQVKLLRFLDSGEVRRVGSNRVRRVDVRVVAATNRNLESMVKDGTFREDLYFRIAQVTVAVPALRERGEDVILLRDYLADEAVRETGLQPARWSHETDDLLRAYRWPGNIRELRQVVGQALLAAGGDLVTAAHLPATLIPAKGNAIAPARRWDAAHRDLRVELIRGALERSAGNRSGAARELGISRQTLLYHIGILGLEKILPGLRHTARGGEKAIYSD